MVVFLPFIVPFFLNFGLGFQFRALPPGSTAASVAYCMIPRFSKRSYFGRQVPLASTTRGSPLAAKGGTMGEKWWPNGGWGMHPGFFYMPQICDMGPINLLPFRRKACWGFLSPCKNPTASVWTRELGYQKPARYLWTTGAALISMKVIAAVQFEWIVLHFGTNITRHMILKAIVSSFQIKFTI